MENLVLKPEIWSNFSSKASNLTKNQFFKTPNLTAAHSVSPYFWPCGWHSYQNGSWVPPWDFNVTVFSARVARGGGGGGQEGVDLYTLTVRCQIQHR